MCVSLKRPRPPVRRPYTLHAVFLTCPSVTLDAERKGVATVQFARMSRPARPSSAPVSRSSPRASPRDGSASVAGGATFPWQGSYTAADGSSCGMQLNGRFRSAPQYSWGTAATGMNAPRVFISKELVADLAGGDSPGPMYNPQGRPASYAPPSYSFPVTSYRDARPPRYNGGPAHVALHGSFGTQHETHKPSAGIFSFGTSARSHGSALQVNQNRDSVAGEYTAEPLGANITDSRRPSSSKFSQSKSPRFHSTPVLKSPGPGQYSLRPAHGNQLESTRPSKPSTSFSKADRNNRASLPQPSASSPGPVYKQRAAVGKQVSSIKPNSPRFGFGSSSRFAKVTTSDAPGPGAYSPCM